MKKKKDEVFIENFPQEWIAIRGHDNLILVTSYRQQKHALVLFQQEFRTERHNTTHGERVRTMALEATATTEILRGGTLKNLVKERKFEVLGVFPFDVESYRTYSISNKALYALFDAIGSLL